MAANTQPYPFFPKGDGVRYPIRQTSIKSWDGNLKPSTSAKLYAYRKNPRPYSTQIHSTPDSGTSSAGKPSWFATYGTGLKRHKGEKKKEFIIRAALAHQR